MTICDVDDSSGRYIAYRTVELADLKPPRLRFLSNFSIFNTDHGCIVNTLNPSHFGNLLAVRRSTSRTASRPGTAQCIDSIYIPGACTLRQRPVVRRHVHRVCSLRCATDAPQKSRTRRESDIWVDEGLHNDRIASSSHSNVRQMCQLISQCRKGTNVSPNDRIRINVPGQVSPLRWQCAGGGVCNTSGGPLRYLDLDREVASTVECCDWAGSFQGPVDQRAMAWQTRDRFRPSAQE
ncbi:hypothetical protein EDB92DRAFT_514746 [Lactarius akahatsu]|uniref:Uncharacterized protein n=1 Tax=Lactarius akahatsu TaxID=416441 RepID=A0AAD4Q8P8_9AGAM|nr:hypothetical protein EDB92DRAFT_514746 [Lactarius akahatsu]